MPLTVLRTPEEAYTAIKWKFYFLEIRVTSDAHISENDWSKIEVTEQDI